MQKKKLPAINSREEWRWLDEEFEVREFMKSLDMSQYKICCHIDSLKFLEKKEKFGE